MSEPGDAAPRSRSPWGVRRPPSGPPQCRGDLLVQHGRRFRPGGLPQGDADQPRRRRVRHRRGPARHHRLGGRDHRGHGQHGRAGARALRSDLRRQQARRGGARAVHGDSYAAEGVRVHALCPSFAYTDIIKGSEQTLLDMGFPSSTSATSSMPSGGCSIPRRPGTAGTPWRDGRASRSAFGTPRAPGSTDRADPTRRLPRRGSTPGDGYCWGQQSGDGSRRGAHTLRTAAIG